MRQEGTAEGVLAEGSWFATSLAEMSPVLAVLVVAVVLALAVACGLASRAGSGRAAFSGTLTDGTERVSAARVPEAVEAVADEEVLRIWLAAELGSRRFRVRLRKRLEELGCDETLVVEGPFDDPARGRQLQALIAARGVVWDNGLPDRLSGRRWQRETHRVSALIEAVRYGPHEGWLAMSGGTRRPQDVALRCRAGQIDAPHTRLFKEIAEAYRRPPTMPSIILLDAPDGSLTAVEGHARLSGLALALLDGPLPSDTIEVIVGYRAAEREPAVGFRNRWRQALRLHGEDPDSRGAALWDPTGRRNIRKERQRHRVSATRPAHSPPEIIPTSGPRCRPPATS